MLTNKSRAKTLWSYIEEVFVFRWVVISRGLTVNTIYISWVSAWKLCITCHRAIKKADQPLCQTYSMRQQLAKSPNLLRFSTWPGVWQVMVPAMRPSTAGMQIRQPMAHTTWKNWPLSPPKTQGFAKYYSQLSRWIVSIGWNVFSFALVNKLTFGR